MRDHPSLNADNDAQLSELIRLAVLCSEESHTSSLSTTPEMTPTHTPSSSPPSRRKKKQTRPSSGTKSPSKEKTLSVSSVGSGGIPSARNSYNKLPIFEEQHEEVPADLEVLSVPLADTWNTERVYIVQMSSEKEVSVRVHACCCMSIHLWLLIKHYSCTSHICICKVSHWCITVVCSFLGHLAAANQRETLNNCYLTLVLMRLQIKRRGWHHMHLRLHKPHPLPITF